MCIAKVVESPADRTSFPSGPSRECILDDFQSRPAPRGGKAFVAIEFKKKNSPELTERHIDILTRPVSTHGLLNPIYSLVRARGRCKAPRRTSDEEAT